MVLPVFKTNIYTFSYNEQLRKIQRNFIDKFLLYHTSLKPNSHLPEKLFICFSESSLKMMKSAFYFILKALFVLKVFNFLS